MVCTGDFRDNSGNLAPRLPAVEIKLRRIFGGQVDYASADIVKAVSADTFRFELQGWTDHPYCLKILRDALEGALVDSFE